MVETPFSETLRHATQVAHRDAETRTFARDLVGGRLPIDRYIALTGQLRCIYAVLEEAAEVMRSDPVAGAFVTDDLTRGPALDRDLAQLVGDDVEAWSQPLPATAAYCDRIREVMAEPWPGGFVSHHYTRYLGDLSGGQVISRAVRKAYALSDGEGVAFYDFARIADAGEFKAAYRRRLDAAPWDASERARIVDEASRAFAHNAAVFDDLAKVAV